MRIESDPTRLGLDSLLGSTDSDPPSTATCSVLGAARGSSGCALGWRLRPVPNPAAARLFGAARSVGRVAIRDFFFTGLGQMDTGCAGTGPGYAPDIFQSRSGHPIGPRG